MSAPDVIVPDAWATLVPGEVAPRSERHTPKGVLQLTVPVASPPRPGRRPRTRTWVRRADLAIIILVLCAVHVRTVLQTLAPDWASLSMVSLRLGHALVLLACACFWIKTYEIFDLYGTLGRLSLQKELKLLAMSSVLGVGVTVLAHGLISDAVAYHGPRTLSNATLLWTTVVILTACVHSMAWRLVEVPAQRVVRHVLIVGSGPRAVQHYQALMRDTKRRSHVVGFVDIVWHTALSSIGIPLIGRLPELEEVLTRTVVDEVYVALPLRSCYNEFQRTIHLCERLGVPAVYNIDAFEYRISPPKYEQVGGMPIAMLNPVVRASHLPFKRAIDVICSAIALLILSPVFLAISLLIRVTSPGPVFFAQERFGQRRRRFRLYKFRSMRIDAEEVLQRDPALWSEYQKNHFKVSEDRDPRITPLGRILRKTSLDELPQLWNVFRGDMSVIGPRPIVPAEIEHYGSFSTLLLSLKPGLTGAWVVHGRSNVGYPRRAEIELSYVRQWSLWHDLRIFLRTIPAVLVGRGAH